MSVLVQPAPGEPGIEEPKLRRLLDYWEERRGARPMPARADLDPADIADILPYICLVDVAYDPSVFRFRLAGTEVVRLFGEEVSGMTTDQLESVPLRALLRRQFEQMLSVRAPAWDDGTLETRNGTVAYSRLLLPLSADGRVIDMLMGCLVWAPACRPGRPARPRR